MSLIRKCDVDWCELAAAWKIYSKPVEAYACDQHIAEVSDDTLVGIEPAFLSLMRWPPVQPLPA